MKIKEWLFNWLVKDVDIAALALKTYKTPDKLQKVINCQWKECFENEDGKCILQEIVIERRTITAITGLDEQELRKPLMWCSEFGQELKPEFDSVKDALMLLNKGK